MFSLLESRQVHLTAVCLLRDYLTTENHKELLAEVSNKTKLHVHELLAARFPRPDVNSYVRKLPDMRPAKQTALTAPPALDTPQSTPPISPAAAPPPSPTRARIEPTSEARYRIQLNASSSLKEKLELFQALVSHSVPSGDVAAVLECALDLAFEQMQSSVSPRPIDRADRILGN